VLSLSTAAYESLQVQAERQERAHTGVELLNTSQIEQKAGNLAGGAWTSLQSAVKEIDSQGMLLRLTGGLPAEQARVHTAQQDLAMQWLREAARTVPEGHHASEVSDQVIAVLSNAASQATGERKADLQAHIGWAYELKVMDGAQGLQVEQFYRDALALDPTNPYANVFSALPVVEQTSASEEGIAKAKQHYTAALSSGRAQGELRRWIRDQELGSVRTWLSYPAAAAFFWQTVDAMRQAGEPFDEATLADLRSEYLGNEISVAAFGANLTRVLTYVPATSHVALLSRLVPAQQGENQGYLQVCLALALEKTGKPQDALAAWRAAKASPAASNLGKPLDEAIKRLAAVKRG
jgi:hypothetical protein